eukprot:600528-Prorocentrum_minimum.AAC.6
MVEMRIGVGTPVTNPPPPEGPGRCIVTRVGEPRSRPLGRPRGGEADSEQHARGCMLSCSPMQHPPTQGGRGAKTHHPRHHADPRRGRR